MADDSESNQRVATLDDLTNEQFAKVIVQAQKALGSRSQKTFGEGAVVAVHRHRRQLEEVE